MTHSGTFTVHRTVEDVFALLADPQQFAPLFPDSESVQMQDATHFQLRTLIVAGQIRGHANLAMERYEVVSPSRVGYRGEGVVAGGPLRMQMDFQIGPCGVDIEVRWQGQVSLGGGLAFLAGHLVESMAGENFRRMAEKLEERLQSGDSPLPADSTIPSDPPTPDPAT